MLREQTSVRFRITSAKLSAKDIQTRIGIEPDETWKVGDVRGQFGNAEKKHGFVLESKSATHQALDEQVKAMLKRLTPNAQKIGALAGEAVIEFICIVHLKAAPMLRFERDDLRWLGVMGARLDVDIFILTGEKAKGPSFMVDEPAAPPAESGPAN